MYWPVTKGTSWPTTISASSLSVARMTGVDRMLVAASPASAVSSTAHWVPLTPTRPTPAETPFGNATAPPPITDWMMLESVVGPRFVINAGVVLLESGLPTASCTPSSEVRSDDTSAITASTSTCARLISNWRTTDWMDLNSWCGAETSSALLNAWAWILTGDPLPVRFPSSVEYRACSKVARSSALAYFRKITCVSPVFSSGMSRWAIRLRILSRSPGPPLKRMLLERSSAVMEDPAAPPLTGGL